MKKNRKKYFSKWRTSGAQIEKYVKALEHDQKYRKMTLQIVKNSISVFDKFNDIRNNQSLAHDNNRPASQ